MATETTTIVSSVEQVYVGGTEAPLKIVGMNRLNNSLKNYVIRYSFTTGSEGASSVSWKLGGNSHSSETGNGGALRWYITTSGTSYSNASSTTTKYHGNVTVSVVDYYDVFSGGADMVMLPNTTYYLWIFPASTAYGFYYLTPGTKATITTSGSAGLVRIHDGSAFHAYKCVIYNGSKWEAYMPKIYNGSSWDLSG